MSSSQHVDGEGVGDWARWDAVNRQRNREAAAKRRETTITRIVVTLSDGTEIDIGTRDSVVRKRSDGRVVLNATLTTGQLLSIVSDLPVSS